MFKSYFIAAYRNLMHRKLDSFLNIAGLAIGLAVALMIATFLKFELSYDGFWQDQERIYRLQTRWVMEGREDTEIVHVTGPLKAVFDAYFSDEIDAVARLHNRPAAVEVGSRRFSDTLTMADAAALDIFDFTVLEGDARAALGDKTSLILTRSLARKYFGDAPALGETVTLKYSSLIRDYTVGAIIADMPANSHLLVNALVLIDETDFIGTNGEWMFSNWNAANNHMYFKLRPGVKIAAINDRLTDFTDTSVPDDDGKASLNTKYSTLAVRDIHLDGVGDGPMKPGGDRTVVQAFSIAALLMVLVAIINYVNLATARAGARAREISLRKLAGASRLQLMTQFMTESFVVVLIAIVIALAMAEAFLPLLTQLLALPVPLTLDKVWVYQAAAGTLLVVGMLSGFFPSLVLASFRPADNLKANRASETTGAIRSRNVLVVFQTAVSISLIVATVIVFAQLTFFRTLDRGFNPSKLLTVTELGRDGIADRQELLKQRLERLPEVANVSLVYEAPTLFYENNVRIWFPGQPDDISFPLGTTRIDYDWFDTFQVPLLAGRGYDRAYALDGVPSEEGATDGSVFEGNTIINARAARVLGFGSPENALGKTIQYRSYTEDDGVSRTNLAIIGVTKDIRYHSLKRPVRPMLYQLDPYYHSMVVRYRGDPGTTLAAVKAVWDEVAPDISFEYFHVEDALALEFRSEQNQSRLFLGFSILTALISCLGLYGLASFITDSRRKEIGIRKVMGAGIRDILLLLMTQFSKPVVLANALAWPVIGYLMNDWLQQYPLRISTGWIGTTCVVAGLIALMVAWVTVGTKALKVARESPIHALRCE